MKILFRDYIFPILMICILVFALCFIFYKNVQILYTKKIQLQSYKEGYEKGYIDCAKDLQENKPLKIKFIKNLDGTKVWIYDK